MNRVDAGWQARWEMLKICLNDLPKGNASHEMIDARTADILDIMRRLEVLVDPVLARDIYSFTSPLDGQPRNVFEPMLATPELPSRKELPDGKGSKAK